MVAGQSKTFIKIASEEEFLIVVSLVLDGFKEIEKEFEFDYDCIAENVMTSLQIVPSFIVYSDLTPIGVASLNVCSVLWSKDKVLTTNIVHVLKEYRTFAIIKELYGAVRKFADLKHMIYLDVFHGQDRSGSKLRLAKMNELKELGSSIYYKG